MQLGAEVSSTVRVEPSDQDMRYGMFMQLDKRAREIERLLTSTWVELADLIATMRDCAYWREGGYTSLHSWLKSACPCSRSWAYLAVGAYDELKADIPVEELRQMPLSNADILKKLPRASRKDPKILAGAKSKPPREFLPAVIAACPESHLEQFVAWTFKFTTSQAKTMAAFFEAFRLLSEEDPGSDETILEDLTAEWMLENQERIQEMTHVTN